MLRRKWKLDDTVPSRLAIGTWNPGLQSRSVAVSYRHVESRAPISVRKRERGAGTGAGFSDADPKIKCIKCKFHTGFEIATTLPSKDVCGYSGRMLPPGVSVCPNLRRKKYIQCSDHQCAQFLSMNPKHTDQTPADLRLCGHPWKIALTPPCSTSNSVSMQNFMG
ncbi:hypothetical protein PGT21_010165 [Puccinia graminis f. sp. tritici]|uniref:Uncharacterized protein n=1 Tax=Puccinia graminis f. sp. tritici TaxID=56615 RepID=A0A5B0MWP8_PUCGR|nr:hypothetical protein PGT21_010165 [Puccinia graminis f. sp. tritici]